MQWRHESERWKVGCKPYSLTLGRYRVGGVDTSCLAVRACRRVGAAASFAPLVPPAASADGDAPQGATSGPVPSAGLAEVAGLGETVVVEVAKFSVG